MNTINQFLEDNARRLLEITPTSWIKEFILKMEFFLSVKRLKKEKGQRLIPNSKKSDVLQWYKSL